MGFDDEWVPLTQDEEEDLIEEIIEFEGGYRKIERWRKNNEISNDQYFDADDNLHREDGPADIGRYGQTGTISHAYYYQHGKPHRVDGPASQNWWSDGALEEESWSADGKRHRPGNKPAEIWMEPSGEFAFIEKYYVEGRLHRTDGPAVIERREHRDKHKGITIIENEKYYHHGLQQTGPVDDPNLTPG